MSLQFAGTPLKEDTPRTLDGFVDFSFARRAYKEIKAEGWESINIDMSKSANDDSIIGKEFLRAKADNYDR